MTAPVYSAANPAHRANRAAEDRRLIARYRETGDQRVRDQLVFTYAPLVKYLVGKKLRTLPSEVSGDDLISAGLEAILRCIDRYDPEVGSSLEAFIWTRVQGAILDELRRDDWVPRSVRRHEREVATAGERFVREHGRDPDEQDLADALGVPLEQFRERQHDVATATLGSLNATLVDTDGADIERMETLRSDDDAVDPEHAMMSAAASERLREAIAELTERERSIMVMLHTHHMTLAETGAVLGVTESRVSQLHTRIRNRLAEALEDDRALFEMV